MKQETGKTKCFAFLGAAQELLLTKFYQMANKKIFFPNVFCLCSNFSNSHNFLKTYFSLTEKRLGQRVIEQGLNISLDQFTAPDFCAYSTNKEP